MSLIRKIITDCIRPHTLEPNKPFNAISISVEWQNGNTDRNIAIYLSDVGNIYLWHHNSSQEGSSPPDFYQYREYPYSWIIYRPRDTWDAVFKKVGSIKYLQIGDTQISYNLVKELSQDSNPFKNFNKINFIPKLLKGDHGTYTQ